jgi:Zn-dependent M16 (insulinase) family peptidase
MLGRLRTSFAPVATLALALSACAASPGTPAAPRPPAPATAAKPAPELGSLHENDHLAGFVAKALYVDDDGRPRGARFVHEGTGFVFDYLVIESAPQAMLYAQTYPMSDGGEPHTQEHLLLGKGNEGRRLGNFEHASFSRASAFTASRRTTYHFNTAAGADTFWALFRTHLHAVLHPDYSDEEIRREVRNFGIAKQPDGSLALDEKGTVYNEMVRTSETPGQQTWYAMLRLLYGDGHPLSNDQGGTPEGIRGLTPEAIRAFHAAHYQLGNMGCVGAFPSSLSLGTVLAHVGGILDASATPGAPKQPLLTEATLPPFHPAALGTTRVVDYPYASSDNPGPAMLAWPATRRLDLDERTVMELFLHTFGSGRGSNLYKALVDQKTRVLELGATDTWAWTRDDEGQPVYMGVESVAAAHADEASMKALRDVVRAELERVAALPDGSKELAAFNERVKARILERRRSIDKALDTPPEFGSRSTGEYWIENLDDLGHSPGFVRSLAFHGGIARALALAESSKNEWRDRIRAWGLLESSYAVVARPSPELRARLDREREARVAAELARLEAKYGTHDAQEALRKRQEEIDEASAAIAKAEKEVPLAPLAPDPPMTNDDGLKWTSETRGGITRVASTFDAMKSATVGLNLRLDTVPDEQLPWLAVLPSLMSDVGVLREGKAIPYDEVEDRLRREVLSVQVGYSTDSWTGRAELAVEASGNDVDETRRALGWARDFLSTPDWRPDNLPRIRDVVDQLVVRLHDTMTGPEEWWVESVEEAYRRQDRPVLTHASSFLTRAHDAFVVSWRLQGGEDAKGVAPFLETLAGAGKKLDRATLAKLAEALASDDAKAKLDPATASWVRAGRALPKPAQSRVRKAGRDLGRFLVDVPDATLASDWADLCREMARGVARPPREALQELTRTLAAARHASNGRLWLVGSSKHQAAVADDVEKTLASLDPSPAPRVEHPTRMRVIERARARGLKGDSPFVALMNPNTANGSIVHTAPSIGLGEQREDALVSYLAVNVFGGEGTQSFYKRMWGAALAYSDYVYASVREERMELYADRCADLPQLLRFGEAEVRRMPGDPGFVDYAVVPAFGSRVSETFEARARAMATDLNDGRTPERIRAFRERLLALRSKPGLAEAMHARFLPAMSAVLPELAGSSPLPDGAVYFTTGPEAAIAAYEKEIARSRGEGTKVLRLWPRDFWDVGPGAISTAPR